MACVLAVVVESVGVGREGEGALVLFPKAVDGLGHVGRADAPYPGQVGLFPFIGYPCVGDQVIVTYGVSDPAYDCEDTYAGMDETRLKSFNGDITPTYLWDGAKFVKE